MEMRMGAEGVHDPRTEIGRPAAVESIRQIENKCVQKIRVSRSGIAFWAQKSVGCWRSRTTISLLTASAIDPPQRRLSRLRSGIR